MKPYFVALRYVWKAVAETLAADLANGSAWIYEDGNPDEFEIRRREKAVRAIEKLARGKASA